MPKSLCKKVGSVDFLEKKKRVIYVGNKQNGGSEDKESACSVGDQSLIPGSGRSPGEGNGYPLQYSCLEIPWTGETGGLQSLGLQRVRHD